MARGVLALGLLALARGIAAIEFPAPAATVTKSTPDENGFTPKPTESPDTSHIDLKKRVGASALYWHCGWWSAPEVLSSKPASCDFGTCNFWPGPSATYQGCCYSGTSCTIPTTCYDYKDVYTSSKCDFTCQLYNNAVQACTYTDEPYCHTYSFYNGAIGYGCGTDSASTTIKVTSTVISYTSTTSTAFPETLLANQFVISSKPSSARTTYTARATSRLSGGSSGSSSSSSYYSYSTSAIAAAALVPIIVVAVLWGLGYICAIVVLVLMCRRSKRLVAAWYQPGGALNRGGASAPLLGGGAMATNVVPPGGMVQQNPAPMYYVQQPPPQAGTPVSYVSPQMTPQHTGMMPSPAATYYNPNASVPSDRGMSPGMASSQPISPAGSSPHGYSTQPVQQAPQQVPQQGQYAPGAHDLR